MNWRKNIEGKAKYGISNGMTNPNILVLCPDEMRATALGCYGSPHGTSPAIDAWAAQAVRVTQCHTVHPKCVPSRACFLTAQYPHVAGHRTLELHTRRHEPNLVRTLREAGWETALVNKNHAVDAETMELTFDHHLRFPGDRALEAAAPTGYPPGSYQVGLDPRQGGQHQDVAATTGAIAWMQERARAGRERPFFLWLNYELPHPPYAVPAPWYGRLDRSRIPLPARPDPAGQPAYDRELRRAYGLDAMDDDQWRELIATYHEMVALVDDQVARLLAFLDASGLRRDTIVVLWADHGDFAGERRLTEKWDTALLDCITRIPLVIDAPGRLRPQLCDQLVESIDIMPTVLALCGVEVPRGIQGRSLLPCLRDAATIHRGDVLCQGGQERELVARTLPVDAKPRPARAYYRKQAALVADPGINLRTKSLRDRDWRYVYRLAGNGVCEELYDLRADPGELVNLAADPGRRGQVEAWRRRLLDRLIEAETVEPWQDGLEA